MENAPLPPIVHLPIRSTALTPYQVAVLQKFTDDVFTVMYEKYPHIIRQVAGRLRVNDFYDDHMEDSDHPDTIAVWAVHECIREILPQLPPITGDGLDDGMRSSIISGEVWRRVCAMYQFDLPEFK